MRIEFLVGVLQSERIVARLSKNFRTHPMMGALEDKYGNN